MADLDHTTRLSGGELLVDAATVPMLRDALELLLRERRDLWTARSPDDRRRVDRLHALVAAAWAGTSVRPSPEAVGWPAPPLSGCRSIASVQEAAEVLNVTPERVRQLLAAGTLTGDQDRPGGPWRIDRTDLDRLAAARKAAA